MIELSFPIDKMIAVRRAIHSNPELSNNEYDTQRIVRDTLISAGITSIDDIAGTGLLVDIVGKQGPGPIIGLRADMDALPIQEATSFDFASQNPGVMHACGHDVHTSILVGSIIALHEVRDRYAGTIRCIFQPAEEAEPLGGKRVVASGILSDVEGVFALHVDSDIEVGKIGVRSGPLLAGGQEFRISVRGKAGHAARPHLSIDAIVVGAEIVRGLQHISSRQINPLDPVVVTVGKFNAGTASNIIADAATVEGTFRVLDETVREQVRYSMRQMIEGVASGYGAEADLELTDGEPVLVNDVDLTELIREVGQEVLGNNNVVELDRPSMGSEDFAFYVEAAPITMFRLGIRNEIKGYTFPVHTPNFSVDEHSIGIGAKVMTAAALKYLEKAN